MLNERTMDALKLLGMTDYERRAYAAMMLSGPSTATNIAKLSCVPRPKIYEVLQRLAREKWIEAEKVRPIKYYAIPPKERIEKEKEKMLDMLQFAEGELQDLYEGKTQKFSPLVYLLKGDDEIVRKMDEAIRRGRSEIILLCGLGFEAKLPLLIDALEAAKKRGLRIRLGTIPGVLAKNKKLNMRITAITQEIRELPVPIRLLFVDGKEAVISFVGFADGKLEGRASVGLWNPIAGFASAMLPSILQIWEAGDYLGLDYSQLRFDRTRARD